MKLALVLALLALGACGHPDGVEAPRKQQTSVAEPGVHIAGYAEFGVARRF